MDQVPMPIHPDEKSGRISHSDLCFILFAARPRVCTFQVFSQVIVQVTITSSQKRRSRSFGSHFYDRLTVIRGKCTAGKETVSLSDASAIANYFSTRDFPKIRSRNQSQVDVYCLEQGERGK